MHFLLRSFYASLLITPSLVLAAGGISSGGGDVRSPDRDAAWFIGQQPPIACVEAPKYPLDQNQLKEQIKKAYLKWSEYSERKKIHFLLNYDLKNWKKYQNPISIPMQVTFTENCSHPDVEIKFLFGVQNPQINLIKEQFDDPIGFAYRESYDRVKGRGKGIVWISNPNQAPQWDDTYLQALLVHEIGHTLGLPHAPGTIMTESIGEIIKEDRLQEDRHTIDHSTELVHQSDWQFHVGLVSKLKTNSHFVFEKLLEKKASGRILAEFTFLAKRKRTPSQLTLIDDLGRYDFEIMFDYYSYSQPNTNYDLFKVAFKEDAESKLDIRKIPLTIGVISGQLRIKGSSEFSHRILLEYNMGLHNEENQLTTEELENPSVVPVPPSKGDFDRDPKYKRTPIQIFLFHENMKLRLFGPSAYWMERDW